MRGTAMLLLALLAAPASAQQSASHRLTESTLNAGGHPADGGTPSSASFRISLGAVGDGVSPAGAAGPGFSAAGGFVGWFAPPGEVQGLRFTDATTLVWDAEGSTGDYALYRGSVTRPFDPDFGSCQQPPPPLVASMATDPTVPGTAGAFFYLVTARNRLGEEGTKGEGRPTPVPCP